VSGHAVLERFRERGRDWKGILLLPGPAALDLLQTCVAEDLRILGVDGFAVSRGDALESRLEDCLDLSGREHWDYSVEELCELAADHVRSCSATLFEVILP
jgi:hypothetical protein